MLYHNISKKSLSKLLEFCFLSESKQQIFLHLTKFSYRVFHSRGQHLCKFIGTKESVYIRKEFNSHRTKFWDTINMAAVSLFWDTNMAAVTSCENTLRLLESRAPCLIRVPATRFEIAR